MQKKIKRTKTMAETIKEGKEYIFRTKKVHKVTSKMASSSIKIKKKTSAIKATVTRGGTKTKLEIPKKSIIKTSKKSTAEPEKSKKESNVNKEVTTSAAPAPSPKFINYCGMIDIVFCCDTTSSMSSYLAKTKETILAIINRIMSKVTREENIDLKFGFVAYRDHPPEDPSYVTKVLDLCTAEKMIDFIKKLDCSGGGDFPEAVLDGLNSAVNDIKWRHEFSTPILRYIIHIADAPPHGRIYGEEGGSNRWSEGCPCGLTIEGISEVLNRQEIRYRLVKVGTSLEKMANIFKEKITNYDSIPLENANLLDIKVSDMMVMELVNNF